MPWLPFDCLPFLPFMNVMMSFVYKVYLALLILKNNKNAHEERAGGSSLSTLVSERGYAKSIHFINPLGIHVLHFQMQLGQRGTPMIGGKGA